MNTNLLIEYSIGGGIPPATSEMLRVYQDGIAVCLIGNAWPQGDPQDEIGLYQMELSSLDFQSIKQYLNDYDIFNLEGKYGSVMMDSGFKVFRLYQGDKEKKIKWSNFSRIPATLEDLIKRLQSIIQDTRQYPVQTLKVNLKVVNETIKTGQLFQIGMHISNRGSKSIRAFISEEKSAKTCSFHLYAQKADDMDESLPPPIDFFHKSKIISNINSSDLEILCNPLEILPGEEICIHAIAPFSLEYPGIYRLFCFAQPIIEVILDGKPIIVNECLIIAKTISILVEK